MKLHSKLKQTQKQWKRSRLQRLCVDSGVNAKCPHSTLYPLCLAAKNSRGSRRGMKVVNLKLITSSSHRFKPSKTRSKIKRRAKPVFAERPSEKPTQFSGPNEIERIKETTNRKSDANKKLDTQAKKKEIRSRRGQPSQLGVGMVELRQLKGYYYSYLFSAPASGVERHDFYESCAMMFSMILWRLRGVWRETNTHRCRYR